MGDTADTRAAANCDAAVLRHCERTLSIDKEVDRLLDRNRRKSVSELTQSTIDLVQDRISVTSAWIQFSGPRTFDGEPRSQTLLFSNETDDAIRSEVSLLADAYRRSNMESNSSLSDWEPMQVQSGAQMVIGAPMFEVSPEVYIGVLGLVVTGASGEHEVRLAKQIASRLDTMINFKNIASEHHTVIARSNELLDQDGTSGLGETLLLLQELVRAPKAVIVYLNDPYDSEILAHERRVAVLFAEDGQLVAPNQRNLKLHEGLGGNLVEFDGDLRDSRKAMIALGIKDHAASEARPFVCLPLKDRTLLPRIDIGKLLLIGGPPLDQADRDVMTSVAMELDTKIVNYHRTKRHLRRSLSGDQVEFFVRRPTIANWFFETPRYEEIGMVFSDLCGYTEITRQIGDPVETIRVAKEWIIREIELTAKHGGYFDKDVGDCAVSLFGPPFYELSVDSLLGVTDAEALESLMSEIPPDPERYAYQAVMFALETLEAVKEYRMGDYELNVSIGVEVGRVAIGDLNGHLGSLTAMGDAMNLAARLQGLASRGEIIIGPDCHRRLDGYRRNNLALRLPFSIEPRGEANLKGFDKPVPYFLVKPTTQ